MSDRTEDAREFGALLKRLGLLRAQAADFFGVKERTIYRWLSGERKVPTAALNLARVAIGDSVVRRPL
jgi:DNA-binding transcriptional regulator YiaG